MRYEGRWLTVPQRRLESLYAFFRRFGQRALPNPNYTPSAPTKLPDDTTISSLIAEDLFAPRRLIPLGAEVSTTGMAVPKTAVHE